MPLLILVSAVTTSGCFAFTCPRGPSYCEGDVLTQCTTICTGDSKTTRGCHESLDTTDCASAFLSLGVRKTCRVATGGTTRRAECVDAELTQCPPASGGRSAFVRCKPNGAKVVCVATEGGGVESTEVCERPELACHAAGVGYACVDSPKVPCDPLAFPRCDGERLERKCVGDADAGYLLITNDCGVGRRCIESDAGWTFCADVLRDGG